MTRFRARMCLAMLAGAMWAAPAAAQTDGTCIPVSQREGRAFGCFITARQELGALPGSPDLYWHVDSFPTVESARGAASERSTVVESLGRIWLFTIAEKRWAAPDGAHVATIGPLPLFPAEAYAATYMEGVFEPGMASVVHRHPGAEAWYTLEGSMCLETPDGRLDQRAGGPGVVVAGGKPMVLTGTGSGPRKSIVLILQDATLPRSTPAHDWTPKGICRQP
jgi:hypothetical protein